MNLFNFSWKKNIWMMFYSKWRFGPSKRIPGYTLLLPTPGDLPVFFKIAMDVLSLQKLDNLVEILVIPDRASQEFLNYLDTFKRNWHICPIRIIKLLPLDRVFVKWLNNPAHNHWLQIIRGVEAAQSTHTILHDVDLFIIEKDFLKKHYETCVKNSLACLGVNEVWDSRFQKHGFNHLIATWEMAAEVEWFRSFKPWEHHGQKGVINGKQLVFDLTLLPQILTPHEKISKHNREHELIHFNYTISAYRRFQNCKGPFEDVKSRLLLLRLLIDMYDQSGRVYGVPSINDLEKGLRDGNQRITYLENSTWENYPQFRLQLQRLINSGLLDKEKIMILQKEIRPFDKAYDRINSKTYF